MKVSIDHEAVAQGASALSPAPGALPSGSLPPVTEVGDRAVDTERVTVEEWWTTMATGTADDLAALHRLVTTAAAAQVARDRQAAADIEKGGDAMAPFRVK